MTNPIPLTNQPLVRGHGAGNPDVIFVIDHPDKEDFKSGYALTGPAEWTVKKLLKDQGLYLDQYYRTCLIKTKPAAQLADLKREAQKSKKYIETNGELVKQQGQILLDEINTLQPNLIVPLGELSFNFLTGLQSIRKFRGSVLMTNPVLPLTPPVKVLPALGPNPYLNQAYDLRPITAVDFSRIPKYSNDSLPPESKIRVWVAKSPADLRNFLERSYKPEGFLTFDIETYYQVPTCISLCFDGVESVCVPLLDKAIDRDSRAVMWLLVAKVLASPIRKCNQNIKFDLHNLERWNFTINNVTDDTTLAAALLYPEFPKNLGFLTSIYTELPYFKDEGKEFDPTVHKREQLYLYNAKDSLATWQIAQKQAEEIKEFGCEWVYKQVMRCLPLYKSSEERGIRIDDEARLKLSAKYHTLFNIERSKLRSLTNNQQLNPLSSLQMNNLVFKELGYETGRFVKGSDEESLEYLILNAEHRSFVSRDILRIILNCRKFHKVIELTDLELHPDGRFRHEANLGGTDTGRSSGGKTTDQLFVYDEKGRIEIVSLGHSLQTIGKHGFAIEGITYGIDIRDMYVPSIGYSFVEIDLAGAEARVDRVLSGCFDMGVFDNPGIHRLTGSWLYNCLPSEVLKGQLVEVSPGRFVDRYHEAKTVRHAGERNMGPNRLVMMIGRSTKECTQLLSTFHKFQPEIQGKFHKDIRDFVQEHHFLQMPNGRQHTFFGRIPSNETFNKAISTIPQGVVSDQTKFHGIVPTFEALPWAKMLIEMHDGCLAEVPIGRELEYASVYVKNIESPIDFREGSIKRDYELTIPAEVSVTSGSWSSLKEVKGFRP